MDWFFNQDEDSYAFEPERFLIPPMEGFLRRLFGARWGLILISAPDFIALNPILDFLANYSLELAFYSEFSTEKTDFEKLEPEVRKIKPIEEILDEAKSAVPDSDENQDIDQNQEGVIRHIPRNPECIFIPEIDRKVINEAIESAINGRLVIAGIRAEGSFPALQEFRRLVASDHLAAASLMGILGLNTVRRICPECRTVVEYELPDEDLIFLGDHSKTLEGYVGMGCDNCSGTGYKGQILIHEGFELSEKIRTGILESTSPRIIRLAAKREGMVTLLDSAWEVANAGETTLEEVARIAEVTDPGGADEQELE